MRRMMGSPATGMAGLAQRSVSGRSRVPRPAASTSAAVTIGSYRSSKTHVRDRQSSFLAVAHEQRAVGVEEVVPGSPAKRRRGGRDAALAAFDFDVGPDRRLI